MIFVTNRRGETTYVSPEWEALTGENEQSAMIFGWLRRVHQDDRTSVAKAIEDATKTQTAFTLSFRLHLSDQRNSWAIFAALPSFSGIGQAFVGFMGQLSVRSEPVGGGQGTTGTVLPHSATIPLPTIDVIYDHLVRARSLAARVNHEPLCRSIDISLYLMKGQLRTQ